MIFCVIISIEILFGVLLFVDYKLNRDIGIKPITEKKDSKKEVTIFKSDKDYPII